MARTPRTVVKEEGQAPEEESAESEVDETPVTPNDDPNLARAETAIPQKPPSPRDA